MGKQAFFNKVMQIGIVVRDVHASAQKWSDLYGIRPWSLYNLGPGRIDNLQVKGKPVDFAMKVALAWIGEVEIELIQPLDRKSIYYEFLKKHGEGLHHLGLGTAAGEGTRSWLQELELKPLQSGRWSNETWTYYDARGELGLIFELFQRAGNSDFAAPPPDETYG
jgi:methylmalonyl-CoA/ethylmalonyl-CoA epimerase